MLLSTLNRKSYMLAFDLAYLHLTSTHSIDQCHGHEYFDWEYIGNGEMVTDEAK